jgi:IS6 family transposase
MISNPLFKFRQFAAETILLNLRWYLSYALSYRNLEEMMMDRGLKVDHTTIYRWVQRYVPELEKRTRPHLRKGGISYRVDETYIKIKGIWHYLYRAIDSYGDTIDFMLSSKRNAGAAFRFFRKMLGSCHSSKPKIISVDKNSAYPLAFKALKKFHVLDSTSNFRQKKYLNNIIEQDHRFIKKLVKAGLWFKSPPSAWKTLQGYETMHMIRKGQISKILKNNIQNQAKFINSIFGVAA